MSECLAVLRSDVGAVSSWQLKVRLHWLPAHTFGKYLDFRDASNQKGERHLVVVEVVPQPINSLAASCFW